MKKLLENEMTPYFLFLAAVAISVCALDWYETYAKNSKEIEMAKAGLMQKVDNGVAIWVKP